MRKKLLGRAVMRRLWGLLLAGIMAIGINMTTFAAGWVQENGFWWYQNKDGSYACNGSQFIDGKLYHFDGNGRWIENGNEQNEKADETIYRSFINQQFAEKDYVRIALADLTHDGHEELITVWSDYSNRGITYICIYSISQGQVREILKEESWNFRKELYLCIRNGNACLLERINSIYQGEGGLSYTLYDFKSNYTKNIIEEYSTYVILDTVQGEADSDQFWQKANALTAGAVLVVQDDQTELWPANVVLKDDEAVYEGSCGDLVKENGVYHYSGVIEGYDEALIPAGGDWTQGFYELVRGDFYVDGSTRVVIQTDLDYGFPVNGKSANAWLDDFYARRAYWMALRIKVKGNHIEEIYGIYSID